MDTPPQSSQSRPWSEIFKFHKPDQSPNASTSNLQQISSSPQIPQNEANERRRRQRKLKKLEAKEQKRKMKPHATPPGQRVYSLPRGVRPVSLFIRMGSLETDQDVIPLEYFAYSSGASSDEVNYAGNTQSHPEVEFTRQLIHLEEEEPLDKEPSPIQPIYNHSHKRPKSIQLPLQSALKRTIDRKDNERRPRSLRILDPKDSRTYEPISHSDYLREYREEQRQQIELRRSFTNMGLLAPMIPALTFEQDLMTSSNIIGGNQSKGTVSKGDSGSIADAEEASLIESPDMNIKPILREGHHSPIFTPKEQLLPSNESSDISGYEADLEERTNYR